MFIASILRFQRSSVTIQLSALLFFLFTAVSQAASLEPEKIKALESKLAKFDAAIKSKDARAIFDILPPRLVLHIAEKESVDQDVVRQAAVEALSRYFESFDVVEIETKASQRRLHLESDDLGFIPVATRIVVMMKDRSLYEVRSENLAILDEDEWWLVRVAGGQIALLRQVYPFLVGHRFSNGTTRALR